MLDGNERAVLQNLLASIVGSAKAMDLTDSLLEQFGNLNTLLETLPANRPRHLPDSLDTLISLIPSLYQRRLMDRFKPHPLLDTLPRAFEYAAAQYVGVQYEQVCLLCLDREYRLIDHCLMGEGGLKEVPFYPRRVLQEAFRLHADAIILCHNHPTGWGFFSESDVSSTRELLALCTQIRLPLMDHLLIANDQRASMRCRSFISERTWLDCSDRVPPISEWRSATGTGSFVILPKEKRI